MLVPTKLTKNPGMIIFPQKGEKPAKEQYITRMLGIMSEKQKFLLTAGQVTTKDRTKMSADGIIMDSDLGKFCQDYQCSDGLSVVIQVMRMIKITILGEWIIYIPMRANGQTRKNGDSVSAAH